MNSLEPVFIFAIAVNASIPYNYSDNYWIKAAKSYKSPLSSQYGMDKQLVV